MRLRSESATATRFQKAVGSDRMSLGLRLGQNCVRSAFEMEQFLNEGTAIIGGQTKHFWTDQPVGNDLVEFFGDDMCTQVRTAFRIQL